MFKTFKDFVTLACRTYRREEWVGAIEQKDAEMQDYIFAEMENEILARLDKYFLKPRMIVSYINWAGTPHQFSVREIAKRTHTTLSGQTIVNDLFAIRDIWPHLFEFGPDIPLLENMDRLPENFERYLADGYNVRKF